MVWLTSWVSVSTCYSKIVLFSNTRFCAAPRLITAACYKQLGEKMKLLWSKDLKMNTVHVCDVVRALWHLRDAGAPGQVYNLADKGETSTFSYLK